MRIVLLNLPWKKNLRFGVRAGSRWPFTSLPEENGYIRYIPFPFFLAYATSLLKKEGKEVKLTDAIAEGINEDKLIEEINSFNPELIAIETSTPSFKNDLRIIHKIHNNLTDCRIAICGPHASVFPEKILKEYDFINYVLIGEYERTLLDLVNCLENSSSLETILGLAYREGIRIKVNSSRPTIDNLDSLPWPDREGVPIYKYNDGFAGLPQPNVQIWTSRGCPFQCTFCLWPQTIYKEHKFRKRNPIDVVDEMEYLIKRFNFKAIYFDDDVFNIDRNHVLDICEEINKRGIKIPWAAMARADLMDKHLLESMSCAGLYAIKYGIESADQNILNVCKKNMDLDKVYQIIKLTRKLGIKVHLTFCLGLPKETKQSVQKTIRFIQNSQPDSLQVSFATPFPGTEYFRYVNDKGYLLSDNWSDYDGNSKCVIKTQELGCRDLERIRIALNNNFNIQ
ncbi:MAG: radical SAM protein [Candidatus Omnitrophica bacterium]|nr:radical SAM protein [Candidatus Omnitrophota bacterium]